MIELTGVSNYQSSHRSPPKLIVVVGPTASGKSSLAIALGEALGSVILGADSRQIYRDFDIGTAKPSISDRDRVLHELIDICDPNHVFTVAEFQALANQRIQHWHQQQITPLLVGGTGLYVKAIVRGLRIPQVPPQPALRSQLADLDQAYRWQLLRQVDAASAAQIHPNDAVRTIRSLEVFYATGQPMSALQGEVPPPYPILQLGLDCDPANSDRLLQRIQQRTAAMFAAGFVEEVRQLADRYGGDLSLFQTLGYREVLDALQGRQSIAKAEELTVLHTRQFAKRQRTWFRADPTIHWLDADAPNLVDQALAIARPFIEA